MENSAGSRGPSNDRLRRQLEDLPAFRALLRSVESELLASAGTLASPVLDLGCGDGYFARHSLLGGRPIGVDASLAELATAAKQEGVFGGLIAADAGRLPFGGSRFGSVVANSVLEHVSDLEGAVRELSRVLASDGRLLLTAPSHLFTEMLCGGASGQAGFIARARGRYEHWFNARSRHLHLLSLDQWRDLLISAGLSTVRSHYYFSARSMRAFHVLHYLGLPTLLLHRMTGRWILWRSPWTRALALRWLTPLAVCEPTARGAYLFIIARREP